MDNVLSLLSLLACVVAGCGCSRSEKRQLPLSAPDNAAGLPRLVITHTMGMMPVGSGEGGYETVRCVTNSPYGGVRRMAGLGGRDPKYAKGYRWDLEMAEKQGVDVFGVLLSGNDRSKRFWLGWLETWEEMYAENPSLRIRLAPIYAGCDIAEWPANPAKFRYFKEVWDKYRDSRAWYRHDGRMLFVGYKSPMWWDERANSIDENKKAIANHRAFFRFLGIGDPLFIYDGTEYARRKGTVEELGSLASVVCDEVDGYNCWGGVIPDEVYKSNYPVIARAVREKRKVWVMPIVNIHSLVGQFYRSLPGVQRLVDTWEMARQTDAGAVLLVTWNDWAEATAFAPCTSFNYALSGLNAKFVHRFKCGAFPETGRDEVFVFYRKYHADADPWPFVRGTVERDRDAWGLTDDKLDVIVFAKSVGEAEIVGTDEGKSLRPVQKGWNRFLLKTAVGQEIAVRIYRAGRLEHELVSPERVTDRPYREDLIPWGWSSDCRANYDTYFGADFYPPSQYSQRYGDGVEDWFRAYWWGTTECVPGSAANEDPDGDGLTNREECRLRTNPLKPEPRNVDSTVWDNLDAALGPNTNAFCVAPQRINLNPYPDRLGYPTHGFLFAEKEKDYRPQWMSKWNNNPKYGIGWQFRSGRKHAYSYGEHGGIRLRLDPRLAAVYRFLPPRDGTYQVSATVHADGNGDLTLRFRLNGRSLKTVRCPRGRVTDASVKVVARRHDKLDFTVEGGEKSDTGELVPDIDLITKSKE